jgi:hypothetical protein
MLALRLLCGVDGDRGVHELGELHPGEQTGLRMIIKDGMKTGARMVKLDWIPLGA